MGVIANHSKFHVVGAVPVCWEDKERQGCRGWPVSRAETRPLVHENNLRVPNVLGLIAAFGLVTGVLAP